MYSLFSFFFRLLFGRFLSNSAVGGYDELPSVHNRKVLELTRVDGESIHPDWLKLELVNPDNATAAFSSPSSSKRIKVN
jgi:hypothetical protein